MVLKNDTLITNHQYDFDVFIKSQAGVINLTAYQIVLTLNDSVAQSGTVSFSYIQNSSQLNNIPDVNIGIVEDSTTLNLATGSEQGSDTISTGYIRIGRFRISSTNSFGNYKTNIDWDFNGYIKSGININDTSKTIKGNFINLLRNPMSVRNDLADNNSSLKYELFQNFPNPFNPSTQIEFSLSQRSKVTLNVYNIIGQLVASLINESLEAGSHIVTFNGKNLPSGVYIYKLLSNNFVKTKKMMLLK